MIKIPQEFYDDVKKEGILGPFFEYRRLLPPIVINEENYEAFKEDIGYLIKFNDTMGKQIITLIVAVTELYNIEKDMQSGTLGNEQLQLLGIIQSCGGIMSFSLFELNIINDKFLESNEFTIEGTEYLFVACMLLKMYEMYTALLSHINLILCFDEEFMNDIDVFTKTILSPTFQRIRALFRVTHWQRNINDIDKKESITIH